MSARGLRADVYLWGQHVGAVADIGGQITFAYTDAYARSGASISPEYLPLDSSRVFQFPELRRLDAFEGLPGVLADCLPDRFGSKLVRAHFVQQGLNPDTLSPVQKLLYMGKRAMGALEFEPAENTSSPIIEKTIEVSKLVAQARRVVKGNIKSTRTLTEIMETASSAGGARAKALVAWNPETGELMSNRGELKPGYESWIIKFDGTDKDGTTGPFGRTEYVYSKLAHAAGIHMMRTELLQNGKLAHFMTQRFDRIGNNKVHFISLCGLQHADYNQAMTFDYDLYFRSILLLGLGQTALDEAFRRLVFNVAAQNKDDHTKNLGFVMDDNYKWALAPAYDMTYAHGEGWTKSHQMTINGKVDDITRDDLLIVGDRFGIKQADNIIETVIHAVKQWDRLAKTHDVPAAFRRKVSADIDEAVRGLAKVRAPNRRKRA